MEPHCVANLNLNFPRLQRCPHSRLLPGHRVLKAVASWILKSLITRLDRHFDLASLTQPAEYN